MRTNRLLIKTDDGYFTVQNVPEVEAWGAHESYMSLPGHSTTTLRRLVERLLIALAAPALTITVGLEPRPALDEPWGLGGATGWDVGDYVHSLDTAGGSHEYRVASLSVAETDDGEIIYAPELADIHLDVQARLQRAINAMADGSLGGRTGTAAPARIRPLTEARARLLELPPFTHLGPLLTGAESPPYKPPIVSRLTRATVRLPPAGVPVDGPATIQVVVNGVVKLTVAVPVGEQFAQSPDADYASLNPATDTIVCRVATGNGAANALVQLAITG